MAALKLMRSGRHATRPARDLGEAPCELPSMGPKRHDDLAVHLALALTATSSDPQSHKKVRACSALKPGVQLEGKTRNASSHFRARSVLLRTELTVTKLARRVLLCMEAWYFNRGAKCSCEPLHCYCMGVVARSIHGCYMDLWICMVV